MAKTLGLRVSAAAGITNPSSYDEAVLTPVIPTGTLGSIVSDLLKAEDAEVVVCVDLDARIVHARLAAGVDAVTLIDAVTGTTKIGALKEFTDARSDVYINALNSAPEISIGEGGAIGMEVVATLPTFVSRSIASLINALDDALADYDVSDDLLGFGFTPGAGEAMMIVIDQHTARVTMFRVALANKAAVRALFADGGSLEDAARYEQIPASESVAATALAFE